MHYLYDLGSLIHWSWLIKNLHFASPKMPRNMQMEAILHVDHTCTGLRDCSLLISLLFLAFQDLSIPFPNAAGPSQTQQVCQRGITSVPWNHRWLQGYSKYLQTFHPFWKTFGFWVLKRNLKDFSIWPVNSFKSNSLDEFLPFYTISACHGQLLNMLYRLYQSFPCYYSDDFWWFLMFLFSRNCDSLWHSVTSTESRLRHQPNIARWTRSFCACAPQNCNVTIAEAQKVSDCFPETRVWRVLLILMATTK